MPERTLSFHSSLYSRQGVDAAVAIYAEHAEARVIEREHELVVVLQTDEELLLDAFANHALFETIRGARQS